MLVGLGHTATIVALFGFVENRLKQGNTPILLEQFDKINNELAGIKFELRNIQDLIIEQRVSFNNI